MKNREDIKTYLDYFQNMESKPIQFNEEAILAAYQKENGNQSLSIKILSVFGGILASLAFLGFLLIAGLYNSELGLIIFGSIFIFSSIWLNKEYEKVIIDTVSVSFYIIGFVLVGFGCEEMGIDENIISLIFIVIASGAIIATQNYILSFVSVLIINGCLLTIISSNKVYDLIHVYVCFLTVALTYLFQKEALLITGKKVFSELYNPLRIGLIFSFLSVLAILGKKGIWNVSSQFIWLSSVVNILAIIYLVSQVCQFLTITEKQQKIKIYIFTVVVLLPTVLSPAISGAFLIILWSFLVNYKTGFVLGILSFIYFICQYYYDLNFNLLTKSILLFSTGALFIALYLFIHKKLTVNEKV